MQTVACGPDVTRGLVLSGPFQHLVCDSFSVGLFSFICLFFSCLVANFKKSGYFILFGSVSRLPLFKKNQPAFPLAAGSRSRCRRGPLEHRQAPHMAALPMSLICHLAHVTCITPRALECLTPGLVYQAHTIEANQFLRRTRGSQS